jgi:hypothetical protein
MNAQNPEGTPTKSNGGSGENTTQIVSARIRSFTLSKFNVNSIANIRSFDRSAH